MTGGVTRQFRPARYALLAAGVALLAAGCSKKVPPSARQAAACHGPRLGTPENREKALQAGYEIDTQHDCITKASYEAVAEQRAKSEAANTPQAIASREADVMAQHRALEAEQQERQAAAQARAREEAEVAAREEEVRKQEQAD